MERIEYNYILLFDRTTHKKICEKLNQDQD